MTHYFLENQTEDVRKRALEGKLIGPEFVGQGCTHSVGSDSYGYYVAEILKSGRLVALVAADEKFEKSWTDGSMVSVMPTDVVVKHAVFEPGRLCRNYDYIMKYGKSWYWCDIVDGKIKRRNGSHARLSWNGVYGYRDPSF